MATQVPQVPPHNVPPLDYRGETPFDDEGNPAIPPLLSRAWWLFLQATSGALQAVVSSVAALSASISSIIASTSATQSQLAALSLTIAPGTLVEVTDYAHVLRWTGTAWQWGPGENGSGMLVPFAVAPTGSGWHLCDGTAGVSYLKADGTLGTVTLPNTAGSAAYLKLGPAYSATITAAAVPTITSPTVTNPANTGSGTANLGAPSSTTIVTAGLVAVASATHTHTDAGHTHSIGAPTVGATVAALPADPVAHFPAPLWFRQ